MSEKLYENEKGVRIRVTTDKRGIDHIDFYDKDPSEKEKETIHIKYDSNTGKGTIVEKNSKGEKTTTGIGCYLTSACMAYYLTNFDDNCYELTMMRWLRDNVVSEEDVKHYYEVAPIIVEEIDQEEHKDMIYNYIYDNVLDACVHAIENGDYQLAYKIYKDNVMYLEDYYINKPLNRIKSRTLKPMHNY